MLNKDAFEKACQKFDFMWFNSDGTMPIQAAIEEYVTEAYKTSGDTKTVIHLLRDSDRPQSHAKLMDDAALLLESHTALFIKLHDLKCAIREALCQIEGNKCDLSEGAGTHEALHNAGVQRDMDIIKQCCEGFL